VEAHEGIEDEQARLQSRHGVREAIAIGIEIEAQGGCGDDLDVEIGERDAGSLADALEAASHDMQCILGGIEQHAARSRHRKAAQARDAGGDRHGDVEGEERLAAFGFAADDANGLLGPQAGNEPAVLVLALGEAPCGLDRQQGHPRVKPEDRRAAAALMSTAGGAQVSRNSFSSMWRASHWAATASSSPAMVIRARGFPWA
jgi:hypothetical protein